MKSMSYQCLPRKDVGIEADPVLGEVQSSVDEDIPLQGTGEVYIHVHQCVHEGEGERERGEGKGAGS